MGGGGKGWYHGGGSGYLQYQKIWFSNGITSLNATAGATAKPSSVIYDGISIVANPGQREYNDNSSGNGYSGGGTDGGTNSLGYSGGFDGSDGGGYWGGSGTNEDISTYVFTTWSLDLLMESTGEGEEE